MNLALAILLPLLLAGGIAYKYRLLWQEAEKRCAEVVRRNELLSKDLEHVGTEAAQAVTFVKTLLSRHPQAVMTDDQVMRIGHAVAEVVRALVNNPAKLN